MCEHTPALLTALAAGALVSTHPLSAHVEGCEDCAAAALEAALTDVGLLGGFDPETDEVRLGLMAAGLETPAERRALDRNLRRAEGGAAWKDAVMDTNTNLAGTRTEQSVLISLDTLERTPLGPRSRGRAQSTDGSGLIDLRGLDSDGLGPTPPVAGASANQAAALAPAPVPGRMTALPRRRAAWLMPAVMGAASMLLVGGIGFFLMSHEGGIGPEDGGGPPSAKRSTPAPAIRAADLAPPPASPPPPGTWAVLAAAPASVAAVLAPGPASVAAASPPKPRSPVAAGGGSPGHAAATPRPAVVDNRPAVADTPPPPPPKPAKKGGEDVDDLLGALDGKGSRPAGGGARPGAAEDPMLGESLTESLTKQQILSVVKQKAGSIADCRSRDPSVSGTVFVKMRIERTGHVSEASANPPFAGTPVGGCVAGVVRGFVFPQFNGDPMSFSMPFAL